ncbi:MAG: BatD family protein, partial [Pseudomonadales bacterium]
MTLQQTGKLLIAAIMLLGNVAWAGLTATVDRSIISDLDLVTLTVRASDQAADANVDFSSLQRDFEIITESNRQNSSMSIINGRRTSVVYKDHVLTLSPKRMGNLFIPSFSAGNDRSQPITIRVQQQTASQRQRMNQFV